MISERDFSSSDTEVMNFFRAVVKMGELSDRALNLTSNALRLNPYNYNLWSYRRKILKAIKYDPHKEFCWAEEMIRENPKNFYPWEHRRAVAKLNLSYCDAETELDLTANLLLLDPKSYHAWQHRQWTIQTHKFSNFGLLTCELKFTEQLLNEDIRNNSAWNQRFFIIKQRGKTDFILVKNEFSFTAAKIKIVIDNESAWNYLRGLLSFFPNLKKLSQYQELINYFENLFNENLSRNRHLIAFIIDVKIEMVLEFCESSELVHTQKVQALCNLMADKYDTIRRNYWKFVFKKFYYDKIKRRQDAVCESGGTKQDQSWKAKIGKKIVGNQNEETFVASEQQVTGRNKIKKKAEQTKKENAEKARGIGTDLLFDLMNKYNNQ